MLEEIDKLHPELVPTLRAHPDIGWLLVRSEEFGPVVLGRRGTHYLEDGAVDGEDPLAHFSPNALGICTDRRLHARRGHRRRDLTPTSSSAARSRS